MKLIDKILSTGKTRLASGSHEVEMCKIVVIITGITYTSVFCGGETHYIATDLKPDQITRIIIQNERK